MKFAKMRKLQYLKPEIEGIPCSLAAPITGSMSTDMQLGKEFNFDDTGFGDFSSSFSKGKENKPFNDDDKAFRDADRRQ